MLCVHLGEVPTAVIIANITIVVLRVRECPAYVNYVQDFCYTEPSSGRLVCLLETVDRARGLMLCVN